MGNRLVILLDRLWENPLECILQVIISLFNDRKDQPRKQHSVWDDKFEKSLVKEIKQLPIHSGSLQNVLIVGPIGAGKSSFVNSVIKIFERIFCSADYLHGDTVFCLTDGINIGEEINIVDSEVFVNSSIEKKYLLNPVGAIEGNRQRFRSKCQIHCVILIVSALKVIKNAPENVQIAHLRQQLRRTLVPVVLVLTMVDMICKEVGKDMFQSKIVLEVIEKTSEMFEMDKDSIHPVVNYVNDSEMRTEINIPLLLALKHSLNCASQYYESLPLQFDDDDNEQLLPSNEMTDLRTQTPMGEKLTKVYSTAIDIERRDSPTQMSIGKKQTTETTSSDYLAAIDRTETLLDKSELPYNEDIHTINKLCGRQSKVMQIFCRRICGVINSNEYEDTAKDVWPAWDPARDEIVFVVELAKTTKTRNEFHLTDLEIIENRTNFSAFEKECHMVMAKEKELLANHTYDDFRHLQRLQKEISIRSKQLMDNHKNITAIFPSIVKSVGYFKSGKHRFIETLCISIRVEKKVSGLIPLQEEPIATYLGHFPTDIIAGDFYILGEGPNDFHDNVKLGSAIHAGLVTENGDLLGGTMGCFVTHKIFGLCCLTSAHIILSQVEMQEVLKVGYREYDRNSLKPVYQPISKRLSQFGQVVAAAYYEGQCDTPGVEVALIQIVCRQPKSGSFPITDANKEHTFTFNSGNVVDAKLLRPLTEVFKFGIETGPTFGLLGIPGVSVRYRGGIRLQNQVVIMPKKDATFAEKGDSGSSAFIGMSCPGTEAAIGLVSGGFDSGQVLVTPIHAALKAVQCPPCLHRFEDVGGDSGFSDGIEGCERMECN